MTGQAVETTEVLFLGTDSVVPTCGHDTASFIINRRYLVDTGWGAAIRMQCWGVSPLDIEYLFMTHFHHDHYLGLPQLLFHHAIRASEKRTGLGPLKIVGPAEDLERVVSLSLQLLQPDLFPPVRYEPELIPLTPGDSLETSEFRLSVCRAPHPVPALCYRFEDRHTNRVVTFTGDTAYDPAIVEHARCSSLLIHEASYEESAAPENNPWLHSGAPEAARVASEAGVGKLALVHCPESRQHAALAAAGQYSPTRYGRRMGRRLPWNRCSVLGIWSWEGPVSLMRYLWWILLIAALVSPGRSSTPQVSILYSSDETYHLRIPPVGQHELRIISPRILELSLVTTELPGSHPARWDFVSDNGAVRLPVASQLYVLVNGKRVTVSRVGFKRRVLYAPLKVRDLRIGNWLYLELASMIPENAGVIVTTSDGNLWAASMYFANAAGSMRECPVIHINQVGYATGLPKKAMVGYYLGSLGELDLREFSRFQVIDAETGRAIFSGGLSPRPDKGWTYMPTPYQDVLEADFSNFNTPGEYRLFVPGLGCSLPFRINPGISGTFARSYALGLYHQRCGIDNVLPFTRFVHAPCHTAPADVPTPQNRSVEHQLAGESSNYKDNPRHTAPQLKSIDASLYPFVRKGKVDVSSGHHDAGDYSKYTINSAALIHYLVFAADNFPGAGELDNLGIPESGDGKGDLLQEAKWEADFLAKMQDDDGGFYFLVYPRDRAYENDVLPEHGDPQVVFPKTTSVTAAATAALAQISSSPRFRAQFPKDSKRFLAQALRGWAFLERAWAKYGMDGSYQKITHYGDFAMHYDEIAWASAELFLATGERRFQDKLQSVYDPSDPNTIHWGWERMFDSYGCAARSYAFGARSGRIAESKLDKAYLAKCMKQILLAGQDHVNWYAASSYGTSFPTETKRFRTAGWYFSISNAFDIAVAYQLEPSPDKMEAIIGNINYEMGCNPINEVYLTGVGWKRQHEIVDQYALNDRQALPPSGIPLGCVQEGFGYLEHYKRELGALTFPQDGAKEGPYPFYDRWGDSFNLATEFTIPIQGRGMATLAWLMARSPLKTQPWRTARTAISGIPATAYRGRPFTARLNVQGLTAATKDAQIVWESDLQEPAYGIDCTITPRSPGRHWIEAEAMWPDGRRVSAACDFEVK